MSAVFCLGHRHVLDGFMAAAERGIRGAVIYDGGFAERGDGRPRAAGANRRDLPRGRHRAVRPQLHGHPEPDRAQLDLSAGDPGPGGLAGNVGIVSQSGGFCVSLLTDLSRFGFSHIVSSGNEAVLTPRISSNTWSRIRRPP